MRLGYVNVVTAFGLSGTCCVARQALGRLRIVHLRCGAQATQVDGKIRILDAQTRLPVSNGFGYQPIFIQLERFARQTVHK